MLGFQEGKCTFDIHVGNAPKRDGPPEVIISNHHYLNTVIITYVA